jgi:hypothetical protein
MVQRCVYRNVPNTIPAKRLRTTARNSKLAAQAAALVEGGERSLVSAITDKVQRGNVLAETVEPTERVPAFAAGDAATALATGCDEGAADGAEVGLSWCCCFAAHVWLRGAHSRALVHHNLLKRCRYVRRRLNHHWCWDIDRLWGSKHDGHVRNLCSSSGGGGGDSGGGGSNKDVSLSVR